MLIGLGNLKALVLLENFRGFFYGTSSHTQLLVVLPWLFGKNRETLFKITSWN